MFIQGNCIYWTLSHSRNSRNIYSKIVPATWSIATTFFGWRMKKLLIWSRVPYYNHCQCRFCYHRAKKYHPKRFPLPTLYLRQNLICPPASRLCTYHKLPRGVDPRDTQGVTRGLVNFRLKTLPAGMGHCPSFARNANPPRGYAAPTGFVVPWSTVYTATRVAIRGRGSFSASNSFCISDSAHVENYQ